jgi:hypothetical protein
MNRVELLQCVPGVQASLVEPSGKSAADIVFRRNCKLIEIRKRDALSVQQPAAVGELGSVFDFATVQDMDAPIVGCHGFGEQPIVGADSAVSEQVGQFVGDDTDVSG